MIGKFKTKYDWACHVMLYAVSSFAAGALTAIICLNQAAQ